MKSKLSIDTRGSKRWKLPNGNLHREDGPAIEYGSGDKEWWVNGKLHRENGPAIEDDDGSKYWYINGKRHREDGPAIEFNDGFKAWYLNGINYTEQEYTYEIRSIKLKQLL
jgi:hypothetical protein